MTHRYLGGARTAPRDWRNVVVTRDRIYRIEFRDGDVFWTTAQCALAATMKSVRASA